MSEWLVDGRVVARLTAFFAGDQVAVVIGGREAAFSLAEPAARRIARALETGDGFAPVALAKDRGHDH